MAHQITEACIGCTACIRNCPVDAITGEAKQIHTIHENRCVDCGVCGKICPKSAVIDATGNPVEKVARSAWSKPEIDAERCSACNICVAECTFHCLVIKSPAHTGDIAVYAQLEHPKKCVGCALCANHCPLHAISMVEGGSLRI